MDVSSEMIHALLPIYLVTVLGASMVTVGVIEGIAEATASITKIFSGALSDWLGKRKWLAAFGYGLAAFTKPVFPLAPDYRLAGRGPLRRPDRQGYSRRPARRAGGGPRAGPICAARALVCANRSTRSARFAGPLLAIALMWWTSDNFTAVFWFAVVPAFLSLALISFAVREPDRPQSAAPVRNPVSLAEMQESRRRPIGGWWPLRPCSRWRASARRS